MGVDADGKEITQSGGTNPIFGVDGSPVIHDMFIKGLKMDGSWEGSPSWHTILMIPYGRGGAGFSVLDVTYPIIETGKGPLHMFSIFNDAINNKVLVADDEGEHYRTSLCSRGHKYKKVGRSFTSNKKSKRC